MDNPSDISINRRVLARIVEFTRHARANGFQVGIQEGLDAPRVAAWCGISDSYGFRWGLRTLLCGRRSDWLRYDELFDAFWHGAVSGSHSSLKNPMETSSPAPDPHAETLGAAGTASTETDGLADGSGKPGGASYRESTERADFRHFTDAAQLRRLEELVDRLARRMLRRVARRRKLARRGSRLSLRHTLRKSLRYGGTPLELVHRTRDLRLPRLLLLLDVSGSMNLYSMLFLRFARSLVQVFREIEVFIFHTHLARVTEALRQRDDLRRAQSLALISAGWSGGTRIGTALEDLNSRFKEHLRGRRTVAVIMSDGLDTGHPDRLSAALGKLRQYVRRVLWLNPLKGRPGYEPAAAGMQAALPYVDVFAPAHNLESLAALETYLVAL